MKDQQPVVVVHAVLHVVQTVPTVQIRKLVAAQGLGAAAAATVDVASCEGHIKNVIVTRQGLQRLTSLWRSMVSVLGLSAVLLGDYH